MNALECAEFNNMNHLEYIRKTYGVPANKGQRIRYGSAVKIYGTIIVGMNARLRVRFDNVKRTANLHPTLEVEYL
jgi:hypothetical protein